MHDAKRRIIDEIIAAEGGYVNDPLDSGGATMFGITEGVARAYDYEGDMRDLPRPLAFEIYEAQYWLPVYGDRLLELSETLVEQVVDAGVNMGKGTAGRFLQRTLNVLNRDGLLYPDLVVDGHIGHLTLTAVESYLASGRKEAVLTRGIECLRGAWYIGLAELHPPKERFVYGWLANRVKL